MVLASTAFSKEEINWIVFKYLSVIPDDRVTNANKELAMLALLREQGLPGKDIPEFKFDEYGNVTITLRG